MASRRQEKVARVVKEAVSDCIMNHLSDPRIEAFISVTRVEIGPDLRNCFVFFSMFGKDDASQNRTFQAINHARARIQAFVASRVHAKFCPVLHFHLDENFKKNLETMNLIDKAVAENNDDSETEEENDIEL
ncbi:MAG: 30S ribosome-binding factor RbfA [Candidatus Brocadiia bacterium]|nr:MAG: 30S ribosome-binding factor RbfA [Candidatus Brocadiia bacterium]